MSDTSEQTAEATATQSPVVEVIGGYAIRHYADGWWIELAATGEKLRGPLVSQGACAITIGRYVRLTEAMA